jgi:uncharacterized protein (TIGR02646 family)
MRTISKGPEPQQLAQFRNDKRASDPPIRSEHWDNEFRDKDAARLALAQEQGHLCAYCMGRIDPNNPLRMKIEHWIERSKDGTRSLDWDNLLGVCCGYTPLTSPSTSAALEPTMRPQHCDTARRPSDPPIRILHPADQAPLCRQALRNLTFLGNGQIYSADPDASADIQTLNLNHPQLCRNRAAVLDRLRESMPDKGPWSAALIRRTLDQWEARNALGALPEYAEVASRWLRRQLARRHS